MHNEIVGYQIFLLHAHLPYVRHQGYKPSFFEENWLNEAIFETYLPLLRVFNTLKKEGVNFKLTMNFSPTLLSMFRDSYLQENFVKYIDKLILLANKEVKRTSKEPHLNYLANFYLKNFEELKSIYMEMDRDIVSGFSQYINSGNIEVLASAASHGYLPLLESEPAAVRAQIRIGRKLYRNVWGKEPRGFWLPECGYFSGLENYLADEGIRYFFVDTHGITYSHPRPKYGPYSPVEVGSGVFAFGRDPESSRQIWSKASGYPGDYNYREYYRDIGYELDLDYISDFIHDDNVRRSTGIKYHRITGKTQHKDYYNPDWAMESAGNHAEDFLRSRIIQSERILEHEHQVPIIVSPYDAELFGHWWYEGPKFIEFYFKKIHFNQQRIQTIHPMQVLGIVPRIQSVDMSASSWGEGGYSDVWLNPSNDWMYRHVMECTIAMNAKSHEYKGTTDSLERRVLNQMAREVLLLQSSDWAFILKVGTMVSYAQRRISTHVNLFLELKQMLESHSIQETRLKEIEGEHPIFPDVRFEDFS
jgi:1,4-alpha-glucan branching enzyme